MSSIEEISWWDPTCTLVERRDINIFLKRLAELWRKLLLRSNWSLNIGQSTRLAIISKLNQMKRFWTWATTTTTTDEDENQSMKRRLEDRNDTSSSSAPPVKRTKREEEEENQRTTTTPTAIVFPFDSTDLERILSKVSEKRLLRWNQGHKEDNNGQDMGGSAEEDHLVMQIVEPAIGTERVRLWCQQFEPKTVQRGAWQLRCELVPTKLHSNDKEGRPCYRPFDTRSLRRERARAEKEGIGLPSPQVRVIVVSGSYTMFALNKAIAQAFGWGVAVFEHHVNKGRCPPDSRFVLTRRLSSEKKEGTEEDFCRNVVISSRKNAGYDGKTSAPFINDRKVKVCHVFRKRGHSCSYLCEDHHVVVTCDGALSDKSRFRNRQPLPRCVGFNSCDDLQRAGLLNDQYCGERAGVVVMMSETAQDKLIELTRDGMKSPLFDSKGNLLVGEDGEEAIQIRPIKELWALSLGEFEEGTTTTTTTTNATAIEETNETTPPAVPAAPSDVPQSDAGKKVTSEDETEPANLSTSTAMGY